MKVHYVMPMAGLGSRFKSLGYDFPKPMIKIYGKPFFFWAATSVCKFIEIKTMDFIVLQEHVDNYRIDAEIKKFFPTSRIHVLPSVTEGAVITSISGLVEIDDNLPVVFNDCDHLFKCTEFNNYCNSNQTPTVDGILLTFKSDKPNYSYVSKNNYGDVIKTAEKNVISNEAICGCYFFRDKEIFINRSKTYLTKCNYNEYYMSGVYNIMIEKGDSVKSMITDFHVPFGVPSEYEIATKDFRYKELV